MGLLRAYDIVSFQENGNCRDVFQKKHFTRLKPSQNPLWETVVCARYRVPLPVSSPYTVFCLFLGSYHPLWEHLFPDSHHTTHGWNVKKNMKPTLSLEICSASASFWRV